MNTFAAKSRVIRYIAITAVAVVVSIGGFVCLRWMQSARANAAASRAVVLTAYRLLHQKTVPAHDCNTTSL